MFNRHIYRHQQKMRRAETTRSCFTPPPLSFSLCAYFGRHAPCRGARPPAGVLSSSLVAVSLLLCLNTRFCAHQANSPAPDAPCRSRPPFLHGLLSPLSSLPFLSRQQTKERVKLLIQLADGFCDKGHAHALEIKKWVSSVDKRYRDFSLRMDKYRTCLETALGISSDSNKAVSAASGIEKAAPVLEMTVYAKILGLFFIFW